MPNIFSWMQLLRRSSLVLPVIALVAGATAAVSAAKYVKGRAADAERQLEARYKTSPVVVASQDVRKGQLFDATTLAVRNMPREFLPVDALPPIQAANLLGGRAAIDIRRGTPVVQAAVQANPLREPLAAQLSLGYRALTIQVDQVTSLAGQLAPGDKVDLLYSRGESDATTIVPLLQGVRIIATGTYTEAFPAASSDSMQERDFGTVTMLVTVEDAARIVLAEQTGRMTVLLRKPEDVAPIEMRIRDSRQLLRTSKVAAGTVRARGIELITGGHGEVQPVRTWLFTGNTTSARESM